MNANVSRRRTQSGDLMKQLGSIRRVGVVRFVVAEEVPYGREGTCDLGRIN